MIVLCLPLPSVWHLSFILKSSQNWRRYLFQKRKLFRRTRIPSWLLSISRVIRILMRVIRLANGKPCRCYYTCVYMIFMTWVFQWITWRSCDKFIYTTTGKNPLARVWFERKISNLQGGSTSHLFTLNYTSSIISIILTLFNRVSDIQASNSLGLDQTPALHSLLYALQYVSAQTDQSQVSKGGQRGLISPRGCTCNLVGNAVPQLSQINRYDAFSAKL